MEKSSKAPVEVAVKKEEVERTANQTEMSGAELYTRLRLGI